MTRVLSHSETTPKMRVIVSRRVREIILYKLFYAASRPWSICERPEREPLLDAVSSFSSQRVKPLKAFCTAVTIRDNFNGKLYLQMTGLHGNEWCK